MDTASANRTIIDVVMQGNRELCHSAVIAWLLDPKAEHGLGRRFLDNLAAKLPQNTAARRILSHGVTAVEREATSGCHRYDIRLCCGTESVVIENKMKSIGCCLQLDGYQANEVVVGLGFSDASFDKASHDKFPILTYRDVLMALEESGPAKGDWQVLADHYAVFLRRELQLLDAFLDCYAHGKLDHDAEIVKATVACGENDKRFLLLVFLEKFRKYLCGRPNWINTSWKSDKNMISGVWLANFPDPTGPISFAFSPSVKKWKTSLGVSAWLQIEVTTNILTAGWSDTAGVLQLRCGRGNKEPKEIVSELELLIGPLDAMHIQYPSRTKRSSDSFCVAKRTLLKSDLVFPELERRLNDFAKYFGDFH